MISQPGGKKDLLQRHTKEISHFERIRKGGMGKRGCGQQLNVKGRLADQWGFCGKANEKYSKTPGKKHNDPS